MMPWLGFEFFGEQMAQVTAKIVKALGLCVFYEQ
jgi:hypothetical protein